MKLELVAVLVLCLALGEGSLLKFSLRGLNGVAKRGHGGGDAAKAVASPGNSTGGKEGMHAGGKEEGHPGLGKEGKDEGHPALGQGGETEEEDEGNEGGETGEDQGNEGGETGEEDEGNEGGETGEDEDNEENNQGGKTDDDDEDGGFDLEAQAEQPCPTPEEFKAKLLEVIRGVKNYDGVIQGVASKAMDFVEGGDTTFEDVVESYGSVLEESGKTFGALEFVGHFMTCASTEGTEFARKACNKMIEFAQTVYDPAEDEQYKRKMGEALLEDLECFDAEYDLAAALGEEELAGETALSKKRAIGLLVNFIMELEAYGKNAMEFEAAVRTAYYKIEGVGQEQPDKRGMQNERELKQLLMDLLSKTKRHLRK